MPSIIPSIQNTHTSLAICTSVGFRSLEIEDYIDACKLLKPDLAINAVDLPPNDNVSAKRIEKSVDRTHSWLRDTIEQVSPEGNTIPQLIASIPPFERAQQNLYLRDLEDEYAAGISGLTLYSAASIEAVPPALNHLPRLLLAELNSPQAMLNAISLGFDLLAIPLVTQTSEQGLAFDFTFPAPSVTEKLPLAVDLWPVAHAASVQPLMPNCTCYTCTRHHRAYIHHLLQTKEMLLGHYCRSITFTL